MRFNREQYQFLIERALSEDLQQEGDLTSRAIFGDEPTTAMIIAKQDGVLAGVEIARDVFWAVDPDCQIRFYRHDGDFFSDQEIIFTVNGNIRSLLRAERTALNFIARLSGIATLTRQYVSKVAGTRCRILDTRKTTPGWRMLEKYSVHVGGGHNHRLGLYDMVLIKDNHITAAGGIAPAVKKAYSYLQKNRVTAKIEVEVTNLPQMQEALALPVDRIMLDNMSPEEMKKAVELCAHRIPLEASGNVRLETVAEIAATGVDYISIGALTHSAPAIDFSMKIQK